MKLLSSFYLGIVVTVLCGCSPSIPKDFRERLETLRQHQWRNDSDSPGFDLTQKQIDSIIATLDGNVIKPKKPPLPPKLGGVEISLAPDLIVNIRSADGRSSIQLLGFDSWLAFKSRYVVTDPAAVKAIYNYANSRTNIPIQEKPDGSPDG